MKSSSRHGTGLLLDPYFSGHEDRVDLDKVKGARARAERGELAFGTIDSFLIWRSPGAGFTRRTPQRVADAALQHPQRKLG